MQDIDRYGKKPGQTGLVLIVNFMFSGTESERKGNLKLLCYILIKIIG